MTLLVALGDAKADEELLASAEALAKAANWELRAVHVCASDESPPGGIGVVGVDSVEVEGDPAATLAGLVESAEIAVVAVGLKASDGSGLGRVARALLDTMAVPVLLVRKGMRPVAGLRRLLVPLEGSPSASVAMKRADDAFCRRGREIVMLHVVTNAPPSERGSFPAPRIVDQQHYEWLAWQEEFCMRFSQCPEGGRHRVCLRVGDPAQVIVAEARSMDAELLVLSWGGSMMEGHGSVIKKLLVTAPCPLLIVPAAPAVTPAG